jgi:two-component system, OmpR family, sensor histidine kinase TctE
MSSSPAPSSSLRDQLLVWLLVPLVLLLVLNSILGYRVAIATANEAYDRLLLASVRAIADRVTVANGEISVDIPYVALELFESNIQERIFYKVTGPDGATLTGYEDLPPPPQTAQHGKPIFYPSIYHDEKIHQAALYKRLYDPGAHGEVLIQVGETAESRQALSRRILVEGLVQQGALVVVAALLLWFGVRYVLRPLMRVREDIAGRSSTDITPVDESGVQSEVRPLIQAFNQHADRIDRMMAARVAFVADATHQIRTRLTILRTQMEYGMRLAEPQELHRVLGDAQAVIDQSSRFFNQLLVLAHAEAKAVPGRDAEPVDLAALAHAITLEWVPEARRKDIALAFEGVDSGEWARGNRLLLHELVTNLLDNAIRYTPPGGSVTTRVVREGDWIELEIEDSGPGIAPEERERVFERFYRSQQAQSEGSGLGLAIAREICRSHEATVELASLENGPGLLVRVRIARVPPAADATSGSRSPAASAS